MKGEVKRNGGQPALEAFGRKLMEADKKNGVRLLGTKDSGIPWGYGTPFRIA